MVGKAELISACGDTTISVSQASRMLKDCGLTDQTVDRVIGGFTFKAEQLIDYLCGGIQEQDGDDATLSLAKMAKAPLEKIFRACDKDGSGDASIDELRHALARYSELVDEWGLPKITEDLKEETITKFFEAADVDGDSKLSFDEFFRHALTQLRSSAQRGAREAPSVEPDSPSRNSMLSPLGGFELESTSIQVNDWYLDYWNLTEVQEFSLLTGILSEWSSSDQSAATTIELDLNALQLLFREVKKGYNDNPYHNWQHALGTLHYTFKLVQGSGVAHTLNEKDLFALAISAVCHDIGHRGFNNAFEVVSRSELALRYNDKSPLENHHCARAFEIALNGPDEQNIFKTLDSATFTYVRQQMIRAILATDMSFHNEKVNKVSSMSQLPDDNVFLIEFFLHAGDISNTLMPEDNAKLFGAAINAEFATQAKAEADLGIPVSAFMVGMDNPVKAAKGQIGFIDFVISPMFVPLFNFCPELEKAKSNLAKNRAREVGIAATGT